MGLGDHATARPSDCVSDDSPRARLCIWRQGARQTVHLTTAKAPDCVSGDRETPKTAPGCRQVHSLYGRLSPDAQSGWEVVAGCTVWLGGCRRMHSLSPSGTTAQRLRMVFRLLGWECESGDVSENGIWLAGMDSTPAPSQQTEYRSQTGREGRALIPANGIPFSSAARRLGPHPSKPNTILKWRSSDPSSSQQTQYHSQAHGALLLPCAISADDAIGSSRGDGIEPCRQMRMLRGGDRLSYAEPIRQKLLPNLTSRG